ncbi:MAG: hypothetical protein WBL72_06430, partial [Thermoguttaceae bacterium]
MSTAQEQKILHPSASKLFSCFPFPGDSSAKRGSNPAYKNRSEQDKTEVAVHGPVKSPFAPRKQR